jgi:hypothetical protein
MKPLRPTSCRHLGRNGADMVCGQGINIRELVGGPAFGWGLRVPCRSLEGAQLTASQLQNIEAGGGVAVCGLADYFTPAELRAQDIEGDACADAVRRMSHRAHTLGHGWHGEPVFVDGERIGTVATQVHAGKMGCVCHFLRPGDDDHAVECKSCSMFLASCSCPAYPA